MAKKVLSIVIGNEITKVCEISYKKNYKNKGIRVYKSISFPTPAETIEDGFIKHKEAFGNHLRVQLKAAKMNSRKAIFTIASSKIANREVIIPLVKNNRIMDIIHTGASDYFPVDIKDYILSYIILEKKTSDRKEKILAKKQLIQDKKQLKQDKKLAKKQAKLDKAALKKAAKKKGRNAAEQTEKAAAPRLLYNEERLGQEDGAKSSAQEERKEDKHKKSKKHIRLAVYAAPSNLVKNYYYFADMIGLEIVALDFSGNSSYQMLKRQVNQGTNVFIQLNEQDTVISILSDNILILQRTIGYGISTLVEAAIEQKYFHINNEQEAMELLQCNNLLQLKDTDKVPLNPSRTMEEAAAASEFGYRSPAQEEYLAKKNITESLHFLTNSISRMLDYYKNNHRNALIQSICLSGFGIRIQGIDQFFSEEIGINTNKLEKLYSVSSTKKASDYRLHPSEYMSCIGSVVKPVDFVPLELTQRKLRVRNVLASVFLILLCLGASAALCYVSYDDYLKAKEEYNTVANQLAAMPAASGTKQEYENTAARLEDLQKMEAAIQDNQKINEVLSELQAKLLTSASVQSIQFSDTGVIMNIIVADNNFGPNTLVAKLLMQLKAIELFADVQDSNMAVAEDGEVSLTVSCTYK